MSRHVELLREQHVQLQTEHAKLRRQYDLLKASRRNGGDSESVDEGAAGESFVTSLVALAEQLFEKHEYSDVVIRLDGHTVRAHRFVLAARSDSWCTQPLAHVDQLDFDMPYNIGHTLLRWVYTDQLHWDKLGDAFVADLMCAGAGFKLTALVARCQLVLLARLDPANAVRLYEAAEKAQAAKLADAAAALVADRWTDYSSADFNGLPAAALYKMLRRAAAAVEGRPALHAAVRLGREDVLFLCLIECGGDDGTVADSVNALDGDGRLPLGIALDSLRCTSTANGQDSAKTAEAMSIARSLVSHGANLDSCEVNGKCLLLDAVLKEDPLACRFLLENGADRACGVTNSHRGGTALHAACGIVSDNGDKIVGLLVNGAQEGFVDLQDDSGRSALQIALQCGNNSAVDRLLRCKDISLNIQSDDFNTPLSVALAGCQNVATKLHLAKRLIEKGADINVTVDADDSTLLHVYVADITMVEFLLENRADVKAADAHGVTPLHKACATGVEKPVIEKMVTAGADPNAVTTSTVENANDPFDETIGPFSVAGRNCLHCCLAGSQPVESANNLLDVTENCRVQLEVNRVDFDGGTPLKLALATNDFMLCKRLVSLRADVNQRDDAGWTPLTAALHGADETAALSLIKLGADLSACSPSGAPCLRLAVAAGADCVRAVCAAGAPVDERDKDGLPAVWHALQLGDNDSAKVLTSHDCDVDAWHPGPVDGCEQTLLHKAIDENLEPVAVFLIDSGCSLDATRRPHAATATSGCTAELARDRQTPLHMAAAWGQGGTVDALLARGANVNAQDIHGRTPVHEAVTNHQDDILAALLQSPLVSLSTVDLAGRSALAAAMGVNNHKAAKMLIEKDHRVASQLDGRGVNLLHKAVATGDLESVLFLLSVGVDVNAAAADDLGYTPLHFAAQHGHELIARNLVGRLGVGPSDSTIFCDFCPSKLQQAFRTDKATIASV